MSLEITLAAAAAIAGCAAVAMLARHESLKLRARRASIFDTVASMFDTQAVAIDAAGFPRLEGRFDGRQLRLELIPDTMTIRRLPQLWLSATDVCDLPIEGRGLAILVRPSGADYYSLTEHMGERMNVPLEFPWECLIKGESAASAATLSLVRDAAARLLADARVKEIAATGRGVRIVRQLAEGKRGEHLLLRQSDFEDATVTPRDINGLAADLKELSSVLADRRNG